MEFTLELILGIIGTVTGVISLLISWFYSRTAIKQTDKALEQADKALEQADKNLKTQLLYEDKKQALRKLQTIIDDSKYLEAHKVRTFLESFEGKYVPSDVAEKIRKNLDELEKFENDNAYYLPKEEMDEEMVAQDYEPEPPHEETYDEWFDKEFDTKIASFKRSAKYCINESLTKI